MAVRRMLELKSIAYRRVDLLPVISHGVLRALRFPETTVPALKLDGERISGSRHIAAELDRRVPDPPLLPADPGRREAVRAAEAWGEAELQPAIRRLLWAGITADPGAISGFAEGANLPVPIKVAAMSARPVAALERRMHRIDPERTRADQATLDSQLDRVDELIADGVLSDPVDVSQPNVADLQIASSVRLAMTLDDLRPRLEARPAGRQALALFPDYPGRVPAGALSKFG